MLQRSWFLRAIIAAALLSLLAACGGSDSSAGNAPESSTSAHNDADVSFATQMIPHHAQAIQMAEMAINQSQDPAVLKLANNIKNAQSPEIRTMTAWLKSWNEPVPKAGMGSMAGMNSDMPGMMSSQDMSRMMKAIGPAFDRM